MSLTPLNLPVPSRISYLPAARPEPLARILTSAVWPLSQLMEPSPVADLRPRDQPRRLKFIRQVVLVLVCDAALAGSNSNAASRAESIKARFDMVPPMRRRRRRPSRDTPLLPPAPPAPRRSPHT